VTLEIIPQGIIDKAIDQWQTRLRAFLKDYARSIVLEAITIDMKHRAASLRQLRYLSLLAAIGVLARKSRVDDFFASDF